jgi:peptidoglycan/LPS O-acetylase OafA/YrhL
MLSRLALSRVKMAEHSISPDASPNLDFLRATAVLLVLPDHVAEQFHGDNIGPVRVRDIGHFGVLLFFVHTSLVLIASVGLVVGMRYKNQRAIEFEGHGSGAA